MLQLIENPPLGTWSDISKRPLAEMNKVRGIVYEIIEDVKNKGDEALIELAARLDGVDLKADDSLEGGLFVALSSISESEQCIAPELKAAIDEAFKRIYDFHTRQLGR